VDRRGAVNLNSAECSTTEAQSTQREQT
jgi:hypothetical protein